MQYGGLGFVMSVPRLDTYGETAGVLADDFRAKSTYTPVQSRNGFSCWACIILTPNPRIGRKENGLCVFFQKWL